MASPVEKAEAPSAPCLLCLFRYKPTSEVGTFHENSARLRAHEVQRRVHLPYVPPPSTPPWLPLLWRAPPRCCWQGLSPRLWSRQWADLLGFCWFSPPEWWPWGSYTNGQGFCSRFGFGVVASTSMCCCAFLQVDSLPAEPLVGGLNFHSPRITHLGPLLLLLLLSLQSCPTLCDPIDGSHQALLSLGFSRQEHWSGLPFPSPMHESEK